MQAPSLEQQEQMVVISPKSEIIERKYVQIVYVGEAGGREFGRASPASDACMSDSTQRYAEHMHLIVVAFGKCTKYSHGNRSDDQCTSKGLHEDGVLDLTKSGLLDPDFAIKNFTDDVAFLVFGDPGLVFVTVGAAESVERAFAHIQRGFIVVLGEKFPWAEMAMVHAVEDDTHALPGSNECCNTNHEANGRKNSPASTCVTESDENGANDTTKDAGNAKTTGEDDTRGVAVANGPSNEVGVGLVTQRPFDRVHDNSEGCGMSGVSQGVQQSRPLLRREVQLARCTIGYVDCNDACDFFSERLDREWLPFQVSSMKSPCSFCLEGFIRAGV